MWRNPLSDLDDLPDKPGLGVNLLILSLTLGLIRFGWPRLARESFQKASALFFRCELYLHFYRRHLPSLDDLGDYFVVATFICLLCGTFIFFRRGVWHWQERVDEKSITRLDLK
jgi:hypothetical protein